MTTSVLHHNSTPRLQQGVRLTGQLLSGAVVSFMVFYGMSKLLGQQQATFVSHDPFVAVDIVVPRADKPATVRDKLPPKPQTIEPPPVVRPATVVDTFGSDAVKLDMTPAPIVLASSGGGVVQAPEQDATPVVRMEPKYPMEAARNGVEGWVELSFSIDAAGQVTDVHVLQAEPRRVFDQAAIQALKRWKYRPKVVDGKAIAQSGLAVRLDFNLDNQ